MSKWINCGDLPFGAVSAMIEGQSVRISYRNTGHEADGLDEIREAVEAALGVWIETPSMHRWSAAEGDSEIVQTVPLYEYQPNHEIVFTPDGAEAQVTRVCFFNAAAYTRGEMEAGESAVWTCDSFGDWLHCGRATPGGVEGTVKVRPARYGGVVDRVFQITRAPKYDFACFRCACANADEAFLRLQDVADIASWPRDSVTIEDIGGTDADHIRVDASEDVRAVIETWCAMARKAALEHVSDPHNNAFGAGAHRKTGAILYSRVMRSLADLAEETANGLPSSVPEGAEMFAMQRIYDAAWTAFGDEVDRLRAK